MRNFKLLPYICFLIVLSQLPVLAYKTNVGKAELELREVDNVLPKIRFRSLSPKKDIKLRDTRGREFYAYKRIVVKLKDPSFKSDLANFLSSKSAEITKTLKFNDCYQVVEIPELNAQKLFDLNKEISKLSYVENSEVDLSKPYKIQEFIPNDPFFQDQWHLNNTAQFPGALADADIDAPEAWTITKGKGSIVAVLDTGFDVNHSDLAGNIILHKDVFSNDNDANSSTEEHGTSTAGLVAAIQNNNNATSGVAPEAKLILIRITDGFRFTSDLNLAEAFIFAVDNGADVISNSYANFDSQNDDELSQVLLDAIDFAITQGRGGKGTPVVFAAGNNGADLIKNDFAQVPNVIVVGATDDRDLSSGYSNFGDVLTLTAPSSASSRQFVRTLGVGDTVDETFGGTSSSTPMVAGALALAVSVNPDLTEPELLDLLKSTTDKTAGVSFDGNGHNINYGFGRLNANKLVNAALKKKIDDFDMSSIVIDSFSKVDTSLSLFGNTQAALSLDINDFDEDLNLSPNKISFRKELSRKKRRKKSFRLALDDPNNLISQGRKKYKAFLFDPVGNLRKVKIKKLKRNSRKLFKLKLRPSKALVEGVGTLVILNNKNLPIYTSEILFEKLI